MAGGGFSGLTSQTLRPLSCGSDRISLRNPARPHSVPRSNDSAKQSSLHAVIKMVEPTHQDRCTGKGFKPPKGAVFKRHGIERLGKGSVMSRIRYG